MLSDRKPMSSAGYVSTHDVEGQPAIKSALVD